VNTWRVHAFELEAMTADFPFARCLIVVRSQRTIKKSGASSEESRYYLSSRAAGEHPAAQWLGLSCQNSPWRKSARHLHTC
jgi:hypothetical protein